MIVISNTSPITNLAAVGQLAILQQLYQTVFIPDAVYAELTTGKDSHSQEVEIRTRSWIEVKPVANQTFEAALHMELDPGEAAALALAVEMKADLLLLDERRGRSIAARLGLRFVGLLGVLIEAKRQGYLAAVKPILEDLITKAGFWVSQRLHARVLEAAGE